MLMSMTLICLGFGFLVLIAFVDKFQSHQMAVFIWSNIVWNWWKSDLKVKSIRASLNQAAANYVNTICSIYQGKHSNQLHRVSLQYTSMRLQCFLIFVLPA